MGSGNNKTSIKTSKQDKKIANKDEGVLYINHHESSQDQVVSFNQPLDQQEPSTPLNSNQVGQLASNSTPGKSNSSQPPVEPLINNYSAQEINPQPEPLALASQPKAIDLASQSQSVATSQPDIKKKEYISPYLPKSGWPPVEPLINNYSAQEINPQPEPLALASQPIAIASQGQNEASGIYIDDNLSNQVISDQRNRQKTKRIFLVSALSLALLIIIVGVVLLVKVLGSSPKTSYVDASLEHGSYSYTFSFDKHAYKTNVNGFSTLVGYNLPHTTLISVTAYQSLANTVCNKEYANYFAPFNVTVQGKSYPVCATITRDILLTNFLYNNVWQTIFIYAQNPNNRVDYPTAKYIIQSVKIS